MKIRDYEIAGGSADTLDMIVGYFAVMHVPYSALFSGSEDLGHDVSCRFPEALAAFKTVLDLSLLMMAGEVRCLLECQ